MNAHGPNVMSAALQEIGEAGGEIGNETLQFSLNDFVASNPITFWRAASLAHEATGRDRLPFEEWQERVLNNNAWIELWCPELYEKFKSWLFNANV